MSIEFSDKIKSKSSGSGEGSQSMAIGRPIQFDSDVALENAMQAFWTRGYDACSMQNLLSATGLSKSSLYNQFGSKRRLFHLCLLRYQGQSVNRMLSTLNSSPSASQFIENALKAVALEADSNSSPRGCLIMNTASEFGQMDRDIAMLVDTSLNKFKQVFLQAIKQGQANGEFTTRLPAESMATYIVTCRGGLRTMVKGGMNQESLHKTVEIILKALR